MPGADHNHPDYEQTFTRIATILDVLAQEQLATERTLREFITQTTSSLNGLIERDSDTTVKLNALIERDSETTDKLNALIAYTRERDAETTDKLNALIDLMDRHLREPGGHQSPPTT